MYQGKTAARRFTTALVAFGALAASSAFAQTLTVSVDGGGPLTIDAVGAPPNPGAYFVTVTNTGTATAPAVGIDVTTPADGTVVAGVDAVACLPDAGTSLCPIGALAPGASVTAEIDVDWPAPVDSTGALKLPATCPTNLDMVVTASGTEADGGTAAPASATMFGVTVPLADITGTATGPAMPLADGGASSALIPHDSTAVWKGAVTNNGPCTASGVLIDASLNDTASSGLIFVSGAGDCTPWSVSTPSSTADGTCTVATITAGQTINFSVTEQIQPLASKDAGGDSIIQSAVVFNYLTVYPGSPDTNTAPVTSLVKGPATSCAATGAGGFASLPFLMGSIGLALLLRRRSRR